MPRAYTPPQVFTSGLGLALKPLSAADLNSSRSVPSFSHLLPSATTHTFQDPKKWNLGCPFAPAPPAPTPLQLAWRSSRGSLSTPSTPCLQLLDGYLGARPGGGGGDGG